MKLKKIIDFSKENLWTILFTALFLLLTIPFFLSNAEHWDMPGHKFNIELQKEMLPNIYYFNPYFFTGVDQFTSYPPLFTWLVVILSFLTGTDLAFKIILAAAWISFPFAFTYYARSIQNKTQATISLAAISIYIITTIQHIGGTYISTFLVGNVSNTLAMPFFLITIGALIRKNYKLATLMAIPVLLSHYIAIIVLTLFLVINFFMDKKTILLGISYGVAGFWLLPTIMTTKATIKTHDDYMLGFIELALFLLFFGTYYIYTLIKKENKHFNIFLFGLIIFSFIYIALNHFPLAWQIVPIHYHRLKLYAYLLLAPVLLITLNTIWATIKQKISELKETEKINKIVKKILLLEKLKKTKTTVLSILLIVTLVNLAFFGYTSADMLEEKYSPTQINITGARIMTVEEFKDPVYFNHNQRYEFAKNKNLVMKGLFVESSLDSPRIFALEQKLKKEGLIYVWGVESPLLELLENKTMSRLSKFYLDLFGVQYIISEEDLNFEINNSHQINSYKITKLSTVLVEVPKYNISFINTKNDNEWKIYLNEWYKKSENIVIELDSQIRYNISQEYATIGKAMLTDQEKNYNKIHIAVDSQEVVPVYIKFAYSKKWIAKTTSGQHLEIYRATPNNMIVFTNQDFTLEYKGLDFFEVSGIIITIISLILLIFYFENITRFARKYDI